MRHICFFIIPLLEEESDDVPNEARYDGSLLKTRQDLWPSTKFPDLPYFRYRHSPAQCQHGYTRKRIFTHVDLERGGYYKSKPMYQCKLCGGFVDYWDPEPEGRDIRKMFQNNSN